MGTHEICPLCGEPVNKHADDTWKQVTGWVGGRKKDSMRLREDTGEYAHDHCIKALQTGNPANQPDLFTDEVSELRTSVRYADDEPLEF